MSERIAISLDGVWIVVPAYNEARRLGTTLAGLIAVGCRNIVVVDDGSTDDTADVAMNLPVWTLRHPINRGQGAALQTGIAFAVRRSPPPKVIVTFDADGQHDPSEIPRLITPILAGQADAVLGSRFLGQTEGMPLSRRILLRLAVVFTRVVSRVNITDTHNGFRAFSGPAAAALNITHDRMAHASEIYDEIRRLDLRYVEVPVTVRYSHESLAKGQNSWGFMRIVWNLLVGRVFR